MFGTENSKVTITSPTKGSAIDFDATFDVNAAIPAGAQRAILKINGDEVESLDNIADKEEISFADVNFAEHGSYGTAELAVEAIYADGMLSDSAVYAVNAYATENLINKTPYIDMPAGADKFTGSYKRPVSGNGVTVSFEGSNWNNFAYSGGDYTSFTAELKQDGSSTLKPTYTTYSPVITDGVYNLSYDISFKNPSGISCYEINSRSSVANSSGSMWSTLPALIRDGKFVHNGAAVEENKVYKLDFTYDMDSKTVTVECDGMVIITGTYTQLNLEHNEHEFQSKTAGTAITVTNLRVSKTVSEEIMTGLSYTAGGSDTQQALWRDGKASPLAESINLNFAGEVADADNAEHYVKLSKKVDGVWTEVDAADAISGAKIAVSPTDGFAADTEYRLLVGGIKVGDKNYNAPFIYEFTTASYQFEIITPETGTAYMDTDFTAVITSPDGEPTVTIDGSPCTVAAAEKGVYNAAVKAGDYALGIHELKAVCGDEVRTAKFELYAAIGSAPKTANELYNAVLEKDKTKAEYCTGPDGTENSAVKLNTTYTELYTVGSDKGTDAEKWLFSFDIKRASSDASFDLESYCTGETGGHWIGSMYDPMLIKTDGTVYGTDIKFGINEWHNIKIIQTLADHGAYTLYIEGEKVLESTMPGPRYNIDGLIRTKFQARSGSVCLGNVFYCDASKYAMSPRFKGISYNIGAGEVVSADDYTISSAAKKITLTFDSEFDEIFDGDITLDGEEIAADDVAREGNNITISVSELPRDKEIVVAFGGDCTVGGTVLGRELEVRLFAKDYSDKLTDFYIEKSENKAAAHISFVKGSEQSTLPERLVMFVAAYENGTLTAVRKADITVTANENIAATEQINCTDSSILKAYVWTADNFVPVFMTTDVR